MSGRTLFRKPPSDICLYRSHPSWRDVCSRAYPSGFSERGRFHGVCVEWDTDTPLLHHGRFLIGWRDFLCVDLRISESLMSGSRDKTECLQLPSMWLWGGRHLGSGRDLLAIQTDVLVLRRAPDAGRIIQEQVSLAGMLRVLFIEERKVLPKPYLK